MYREFLEILRGKFKSRMDDTPFPSWVAEMTVAEHDRAMGEALAEMMDRPKQCTRIQNFNAWQPTGIKTPPAGR